MVDPIVQEMENWDDQIVTVWIAHVSAGVAEETINLPADAPKFDLEKAHPIISGVFIVNEANDASTSKALIPENECARGSTPDTTNGDWAIYDKDTIIVYLTSDLNGVLGLTYFAKGTKKL